MKIPVTLLKAAIERHNHRAYHRRTQLVEEAYDAHIASLVSPALLKQANKINKAIRMIADIVKKDGLYLDGLSGSDNDVGFCLGYQEKNQWEQKKHEELRKKDPLCRETSVNTVLLAAASSGTDDVAKFLDSLKLNWREDAD